VNALYTVLLRYKGPICFKSSTGSNTVKTFVSNGARGEKRKTRNMGEIVQSG